MGLPYRKMTSVLPMTSSISSNCSHLKWNSSEQAMHRGSSSSTSGSPPNLAASFSLKAANPMAVARSSNSCVSSSLSPKRQGPS